MLLQVQNLSKKFGTLRALQNVSFAVEPGEIVGLAGPSGAGKTVITNILAGLTPPTGGQIYFREQRLTYPWRPREYQFEVIFQEPELVEQLDITSNIFLGNEIGWFKMLRWFLVPSRLRMDRAAAEILANLGVQFPSMQEKVMNLSSEQRQLIAIARVMTNHPRLVVVDDPTALLAYQYQQNLLAQMQRWRRENVAVLFATNNLDHLFAVTDRVIVLHEGQVSAAFRTDETSREQMVSALVGRASRQQLTPAIWALDRYYRARKQAERLRHQQHLLERDLVAQDNLNRQLVDELGKQVKALDQANLALQDAQRRLMTEREQERKHLARELHDQVIQDLLSTNFQLEEVEAELPPDTQKALDEVRQGIRELVAEVRNICGDLRPPTIDSLGLSAAIQSFTYGWSERTGIEVEVIIDPTLSRLPEAIELSTFRIVQEGLNNVGRHADATKVEITLEHTSPRSLMISISDNGQGLPENFNLSALSEEGHYGLLGMSERVALLEGRLHMQNRPSGGALIQVEIPHPRVETIIN